MDIVFGWNLDGLAYPESASGKAASYNAIVAGPQAFLGLLETRLALSGAAVPRTLRVGEYLNVLRSARGNHFFSRSLETDAWATADLLLAIRDELIAAGWDKQPIDGLERLKSLAEVERRWQIPEGFGERFQRVVQMLASCARTVIERLRLVEPPTLLPDSWQSVISLLRQSGTDVTELPLQARAQSGDLQMLQQHLLNHDNAKKLQLAGDGSVSLLDADDEIQAALFTASWLAQRGSCDDALLIRGGDCSLLTQACRRNSLPSPGNTARSQLRAILQVLPLAFKVACRPIDPEAIIELLLIQDGPIPRRFTGYLSAALSESPGIGGEAWRQAWLKCIEEQRKFIISENSEVSFAEARRMATEDIMQYEAWFDPLDSHDQQINPTQALGICQRVENWAKSRQEEEHEGESPFEVIVAQSRMLRNLVQMNGADHIPLIQLQKMIDGIIGYGCSISNAEASEWSLSDKPGQVWNQAETIIWWGFAQPQWSFPRKSTWSEQELAALRKRGIVLDNLIEKLRRESYSWRLPVINAVKRLVLVKPCVVAGRRAIPHPLFDEIAAMMDESSMRAITLRASDSFLQPEVSFAQTKVIGEPQKCAALPGKLRTWSVPTNAVRARKRDSFSSIEKMLGCPLAWVLQYGAGMWAPKGLDLPKKQILLGRLAHEVVNELYQKKKDWEPDGAREFAFETVRRLIPEMAATLQQPGASPQLREATQAIPASVFHLVKLLQNAGASVEGTEVECAAAAGKDMNLYGKIDLLLRLSSGQKAVIDFKWTSSPYRFRKKIVDGKALQLAIYSFLARQKDAGAGGCQSSTLPPAGFFMFRHSELFFTAEGVFPAYTVVRRAQRDIDETWQLTREAYERTLAEIRSGTIIAAGINDDTISIESFMHDSLVDLPCDFCDFQPFCGYEGA